MMAKTLFRAVPLLLVLCCASARAQDTQAANAAEAAPAIDLPLPWKAGGVLRYATEQLESKKSATGRERSVATATTELRTVRADKDGYEVHWVSSDTTHKTLEGDASLDAILQPAMKQMEAVPMVVVLAADGTYQRIGNIDRLSARMREIMKPVVEQAMAAGLEASPAQAMGEAQRKEAMRQAQAAVGTYLDNITSPKMLEALASKQARNIAFFNGGGLEDGASYEMETELENPTGGPNFPAKLTFGLWVSEDDPEDVFIEWTSTIDPVKGAAALVDTVKRLFGDDMKLDPKELPDKVAIVDTGLMLVHRPTGMVEMYQDERTTTFGDDTSRERHRMALLDAGHGHEWSDAATP